MVLSKLNRYFGSGAAGQNNVRNHQFDGGLVAIPNSTRFTRVFSAQNLKAGPFQCGGDFTAQLFLILDHQDELGMTG